MCPEFFDFFDPTPGTAKRRAHRRAAILRDAEVLIESCEQCNREGAEIP
jgi:hypothetical protein